MMNNYNYCTLSILLLYTTLLLSFQSCYHTFFFSFLTHRGLIFFFDWIVSVITESNTPFGRRHQWRTWGRRVFRVFNLHTPSPGWSSQGWSVPPLCPSGALLYGSPLQIHSHLEAFSAASRVFLMVLLDCSPFTQRSLRVRTSEWPTKPRHPTSTGSQWAFQLLLRHSVMSSAYLALFRLLASSIRSSQGTVNKHLLGGPRC